MTISLRREIHFQKQGLGRAAVQLVGDVSSHGGFSEVGVEYVSFLFLSSFWYYLGASRPLFILAAFPFLKHLKT